MILIQYSQAHAREIFSVRLERWKNNIQILAHIDDMYKAIYSIFSGFSYLQSFDSFRTINIDP